MYVNINISGIKKQTSNIEGYIEDTLTTLNEIKTTLSSISRIWEGEDHTKFDNELTDFLEEISKLGKSLEKYNDFVNGYLNAEETLDTHYANKKISLE